MRRIVVCLDGTWNSPTDEKKDDEGFIVYKPTNVLKLYRAVKPKGRDGVYQISYYDEGVSGFVGGIWGKGFAKNVVDAYGFLVGNFASGDEIFLFGFSRGAAEARSLARFIDWMGGFLDKSDAYYIPRFFEHYLSTRGRGRPSKIQRDVEARGRSRVGAVTKGGVRFLGVFDTVSSLGSRLRLTGAKRETTVKKLRFHVGAVPPACVAIARHALAIDERRRDFQPDVWRSAATPSQSLEQRWFPGVHSNVGGGYLNDGLANVALHWIAAEAARSGLDLNRSFLAHYRPWVRDERSESYKSFYRLRGAAVRKLGGAPRGAIELDPSVIELLRHEEGYRPKNLMRYLAGRRDLWGRLPADVQRAIQKL